MRIRSASIMAALRALARASRMKSSPQHSHTIARTAMPSTSERPSPPSLLLIAPLRTMSPTEERLMPDDLRHALGDDLVAAGGDMERIDIQRLVAVECRAEIVGPSVALGPDVRADAIIGLVITQIPLRLRRQIISPRLADRRHRLQDGNETAAGSLDEQFGRQPIAPKDICNRADRSRIRASRGLDLIQVVCLPDLGTGQPLRQSHQIPHGRDPGAVG